MNRALLNRRMRQLHLWLGLAIGLQVGLWLLSGLFMTWFPIETVRGDHLRQEATPNLLGTMDQMITPAQAISASKIQPTTMRVEQLNGRLVWFVEGEVQKVLLDGQTGMRLSPLSEATAKALALQAYAGQGEILRAIFYETPPREYSRAGPVWRIDLGKADSASFYVDATTGDVRAVRTLLWRTFDFMWGLHIMDWSTRENFNSWWIKMTAAMAVVFFFAGLCLAVLRVLTMVRR